MPRWDFECEACHDTSEMAFPSVRDSENAVCPKCGGKVTRKPPTTTSFSIKGYNAHNGYSNK